MKIPFENLKTKTHTFELGNVIQITGPDAKTYLNSQTTNAVNDLSEREFHHNCLLDNSGKLVSGFIVCCESNQKFYLITPKDLIEKTIERLNKYHISEDLEISSLDLKSYLHLNPHLKKDSYYCGSYFCENNFIELSYENHNCSSDDSFKQLSILTGVPRIGHEVKEGELVNNSFFDEIAVNYSKGCYPGQETVAKIDSRRGAAFKPVLLIGQHSKSFHDTTITIDSKKIGDIRSNFSQDGMIYAYSLLNRQSRVDQSEIEFKSSDSSDTFNMKVHYFPYLKLDKKSIAVEFFDSAIENFQKGDNELAKSLFERAIELDPLYEDAYESLGVLLGRMEQYAAAIEKMEQLKEINPKCLMAYTNLSLYHMKMGNIETAEKFKSDATLMNFQVLGDVAKVKREQEELAKRKEAERDRRESMFLQVLEIDALDAMASNGMGEIEFEKKNYQAACDYYIKAIEGDKKYSVAYLGLAKSYLKLGNAHKAQETLEAGIPVASSNGDLMPANEMQSLLISKIKK